MTAFSVGMASLFQDPNMSESAVYTPVATGVAAAIRLVYAAPDVENRWGDATLHSQSVTLDVRVADVASPQAGDLVTWRGETRVVQGVPERDPERLIWTLDTRPT